MFHDGEKEDPFRNDFAISDVMNFIPSSSSQDLISVMKLPGILKPERKKFLKHTFILNDVGIQEDE